MVWHKPDSSLVPGLALTLASPELSPLDEGKVLGGGAQFTPPAGKPSDALSAFWLHSTKCLFIHCSSFPSLPSPSLPLPPLDSLSSSFSLFLNIPEDNAFSMAPWETLSPAVAR